MNVYLFLYRLAGRLLAPFLPVLLRRRARAGKEDMLRLKERLARSLPPRRPGPLVWLHGASVGESGLLLALGQRLAEERPDLMLLFSSQTLTSARHIAPLLPDNAVHVMAPLDTPGIARRFMQHWKPDLCVFAEGEIWPNLLREAGRSGARCALVNARMTAETAKGWRRAPGTFRQLMNSFDVRFSADADTAARIEGLTGRAVRVSGNLKSAIPPPGANETELARLRRDFVGARRCLLAASTHAGEEALFLDAAAGVDAALIIAPRHPERGPDVAALVRARGLPLARRANGEAPSLKDRVLLADTIGEMGLWLRLADAVYLGGGHAEGVGGHNPLEPIRLARPVVTGPLLHNFSALSAQLEEAGLLHKADDAAALGAFLAEPPVLPEAALAALEAEADAPMQQTLRALLPLLPRSRET
jgi:3-deoxy-D-manno-octulosonic-acid transferase